MCLYPKLILNKKYLPTKKNKYNPPILQDERLKYVAIGCGNCIECRKQKSREWQVRMHEEFKNNYKATFVTLSFSPEALQELCNETKADECNAIATIAVRRFCERWRKKHGKSIKHWLITELGHNNTERIHLHGILWSDDHEAITRIWKYGNVYCGEYCNAKTINYIVKYITKIDTMHHDYKSIILCSAGIGGRYKNTPQAKQHAYKGKDTREYYQLESGSRVNMPIYYRNAIYTEEQREMLWRNRLDKGEIYVRGIKYDVSTEAGQAKYMRALKGAQRDNIALGYGNDNQEWKEREYNITLKMLNKRPKYTKSRRTTREKKNSQLCIENLQE